MGCDYSGTPPYSQFFFWPIGDSINGVPLYVTIEVLCDKGESQRILKLSFVLSGLSFPYVSFRN